MPFGKRAMLKLYAAIIRVSETWKRIVISEFELKKLESLREHLDRIHAERTALVKLPHPAHEFPAEMGLDPGRGSIGGLTLG